ncbi:MAG: FG-GAP repeat protein [Spirochaetes bacterium]|nr:FG-GAP repeat protein [Spirochaetota bacterium]
MKRYMLIVTILAVSSSVFASLLFHKNRNEVNKRVNPADKKAENYQGYETTNAAQYVTCVNEPDLSNNITGIAQLSNHGWKPVKYMISIVDTFAGAAWADMPSNRIMRIDLAAHGPNAVYTRFMLPNNAEWRCTNSVFYGGGTNRAPVIASFTMSPAVVKPGSNATLTVVASDPDGDTLSYTYLFSGLVTNGTGSSITAHSTSNIATTVWVLVSDTNGGVSSNFLTFRATNLAPVIASFSGVPWVLKTNQQSTLTASASDPDGDPVAYTYEIVSNGGTVSGSGATVTYTATNVWPTGIAAIRVIASDGYGGSATNVLEMPVKAWQKIGSGTGGFTGTIADGSWFGYSLSPVGDLDGDGINDFAVGAAGSDDGGTDRGALWVLLMQKNGLVRTNYKIADGTGGFGSGLADGEYFGCSVATNGDMNGDGVVDLIVGASFCADGGADSGSVWVLFMNSNATVKSKQKISRTSGGLSNISDGDWFGGSITSLGDYDGDGVYDAAIGAAGTSNFRGGIWIVSLKADGTVKTNRRIASNEGGLSSSALSVGDQFGAAACSFDVNNDGTNDILCGAPRDDISATTDVGSLRTLFMMSNGTSSGSIIVTSNMNGFTGNILGSDFFGSSLAYIGVLNGKHTFAVGASGDDSGGRSLSGAVWLVSFDSYGNATGNAKISYTDGGFGGSDIAASDRFGYAVAPAGDCNGDSIPDLLVGAYATSCGGTERGAVYLIYLNNDSSVTK